MQSGKANTTAAHRTSAKPKMIDGVTFHCWWIGVLNYIWQSEDGRIRCAHYAMRSSYYAVVDGHFLPARFRTLHGAMRTAVKRLRAIDAKHDAQHAARNVL